MEKPKNQKHQKHSKKENFYYGNKEFFFENWLTLFVLLFVLFYFVLHHS
jgi:hypothetical protein